MSNFLYVDNSNVWIEGMHISAVKKGLAANLNEACHANICDYAWKIDFGKLYKFAGGEKGDVGHAVLYGSRPPENDTLWSVAKAKGFEVKVFDRNYSNKEKKVDVQIAADIVADSYEIMKAGDEITLVAGDNDYVPVVEKLKARNFAFHVVFWDQAGSELKKISSKFISLNQYLDFLNVK